MYNVVIVDDEAIIVEALRTALSWSEYGFELALCTVSSGKALEEIARGQVDLLITDVCMPEPDGLDLIRQAKQIKPAMCVVVVSAFDHFEYVRTALRYGVDNYLLKPIDIDELTASIAQVAQLLKHRSETVHNESIYPVLSFRSNVTERWVKNTITLNELIEKSQFLEMDPYAGRFQVALIVLRDRQLRMEDLYPLALEALGPYLRGHFYFESATTLGCVLSEALGRVPEHGLNRLLGAAKQAGLQIFLCAGAMVNSAQEVHQSYRQASRCLFMAETGESLVMAGTQEEGAALAASFQEAVEAHAIEICIHIVEEFWQRERRFPKRLTIQLAACCLETLEKDLRGTLTYFPGLNSVLSRFPTGGTGKDRYHWMISFLQEFLQVQGNLAQAMHPCVASVLSTIHQHYSQDLSLKSLADKLNVSPSYLGQVFKEQTGTYFNDYLLQERLVHAQALIRKTNTKISQIAEQTGFASQTYFNRAFKRYVGVSPLVYRHQGQDEHGHEQE